MPRCLAFAAVRMRCTSVGAALQKSVGLVLPFCHTEAGQVCARRDLRWACTREKPIALGDSVH